MCLYEKVLSGIFKLALAHFPKVELKNYIFTRFPP